MALTDCNVVWMCKVGVSTLQEEGAHIPTDKKNLLSPDCMIQPDMLNKALFHQMLGTVAFFNLSSHLYLCHIEFLF